MLVLARALVLELEAYEARSESRVGRGAQVGPRYFTMLRTVRQGPVYPDANGTLRFSYATVGGYSPREALRPRRRRRSPGSSPRSPGLAPFTLPERVLKQAEAAASSYWADPVLGDLPINFLANGDTTGGNSGSPVINGRGELVGLNFDRVWENIAGDFGYNPARSRNVIVDVRYMLWLLDRVEDATPLLTELGVAGLRDAGARPAEAVPGDSPPGTTSPGPARPPAAADCHERRSCGCSGGDAAGGGLLVVLALLLAPQTELRRMSARGAVETYLHWLQWRLGHALVDDLMTPDQAVAWHELCRELRLGPAPVARTSPRTSWPASAPGSRPGSKDMSPGTPAACG
jgi:hypothetical protein